MAIPTPISYWKLDESSGNASDSVGSNTLTNNGTITYSAGKINNGANLNGSTQYFSTSNVLLSNSPTNYTISAWVNLSDVTDETIMCDRAGAGFDYKYRFSISSGKVKIIVSNNVNVDLTQVVGSTTLATNTWFFVTCVITISGTCYVYLNGSQDGSASYTANSYPSQSNGTNVGRITGPVSEGYLSGMLDEVGIWNVALTANDINILYNSGAGLQYPFTTSSNTSAFFNLM
jgi:hypothetical protein